jgi:aspartokinase/homoserine dehydrogenase 1
VVRIDAVLSGTINWLFSEYDGNTAFSELVKIAKEKGYTEPDPRDDLSGMDVARKCLILARECGWNAELEDVHVDPLMTDEAAGSGNIDEFFRNMASFDPLINDSFISASGEGKKLRYIASVENGKATVSIVFVGKESPFYSLGGTENCIILNTNYYRKYPMVIKGPGAGVDVTAAGLLADIVRIAEEVRT